MSRAIFTFIFGKYDRLKPPQTYNSNWDYICFTDTPEIVVGPWQYAKPLFDHPEPKKRAVGHMIAGHTHLANEKGYDLTLSIGGQIGINCDLDDFVQRRFRKDAALLLIRHPERACVYDEATACKFYKKDSPARIDAQMARYRQMGLPPSRGLFATGVIGQRPTPWTAAVNDGWWGEVRDGSCRDQLALPLVLWTCPADPTTIAELGWTQTFGNKLACGDHSFILHGHSR